MGKKSNRNQANLGNTQSVKIRLDGDVEKEDDGCVSPFEASPPRALKKNQNMQMMITRSQKN